MFVPAAAHGALLMLVCATCAQDGHATEPTLADVAATEPTPRTPPPAPPAAPTRNLGVVVIRGVQPTSLPTQIPTTVESTTGAEIAEKLNATDSPDALKYFPSLLVRKRYIGDYDHAVLSTRASGTGNSARSLVYADGILLSNLLGNGAFFTPRWGLVTPSGIERVDVLYGPFSAAYPGNSVGAVVDYVTRMPRAFEAHAAASAFSQRFRLYGTDATFNGNQASAAVGNRHGDWSWYFNVSRLDSSGQPLVFSTRLLSQGTPGAAGTPVTGAVAGLNRANQPWWILGASSLANTVQEHAKGKLQWQVAPDLRASYTLGWWQNTVQRRNETYLRDPAGAPVFSGTVNIDGRSYALAAGDFPQTRESLEHLIHGLSLKRASGSTWDWELAASLYDYQRDQVRVPAAAPPAADVGGPGRLTDQAGTGWHTLAAKGIWRPTGAAGQQVVEFGLQQDAFRLRNAVGNTADWISGGVVSPNAAFQGNTQLESLWAQHAWRFAPAWNSVLGLRAERWRAFDGATTSTLTPVCATPPCPSTLVTANAVDRSDSGLSPKAAVGYAWSETLTLKAATGRAVRYPTVSELFQGGVSPAGTLLNNDPSLRPERSWTWELTAEHALAVGSLRSTLFHERTRDALYSQTNVLVTPNVTNIQNVDQIRTSGLELALITTDLGWRGVDLSASLTFADSRIFRNDKFPASVEKFQPRVPRWRGNLLATWRPTQPWSLTAGARYGGTQFNTLDNTDTNGDTWQGASRFFTVDVRARYKSAQGWLAALGIDNLNNATYWNFHPFPQRTALAELKFDLE
jgi:iron complex outermembrane receptor protein